MTTKEQDEIKYRQLDRDICLLMRKLAKRKSCENFGAREVRELKDKYSDYMCGNWSVCGRFVERVRQFENWCDNYINY